MSSLLDIQEQLLNTNAALARMERAAAEDPSSSSVQAMGRSLRKRQQALESAFLAEANSIGVDVCTYRLFGDGGNPTIAGLSKVLGDFQTFVSTVYNAIKTAAPKERTRVSGSIARESSFEFGYVFAGSLGIVLTVPNERLLMGESKLDETMETVFAMARATDSSQILEHAKQLGPASVRAMYNWAVGHTQSGLGVDIQWRRERVVRAELLAQRPELERLSATIETTSDEKEEQFDSECELVGADVTRQSFHLKLSTGEDIRGSFKDAISPSQTVELPKRYKATLLKTTSIRYSTGEEKVSYQLLRLDLI